MIDGACARARQYASVRVRAVGGHRRASVNRLSNGKTGRAGVHVISVYMCLVTNYENITHHMRSVPTLYTHPSMPEAR